MKPSALFLLLALPFFASAQYNYQNLYVEFLDNDAIAKRYTYENLRLYPVYAKQGFRQAFKGVGKYTSLQQAIQQKKIKVREKDASGDVPELVVENLSQDTIIIICGDVVKGGKQDRIIEDDMVLAPKSGKKNIKVYCVESGRWEDRSTAMRNNYSQQTIIQSSDRNVQASRATQRPSQRNTQDLALSAPSFEGHYNKGSMSLRKVVSKEKDQGKVWEEVEKINVSNATVTETKTYTALSNSSSYKTKLNNYLNFFRTKFAKDTTVIGVVVVTGKKVLGCDLFATHALFISQYESLLHSYATEAIVNGGKVTITPGIVRGYMNALLKNEQSQKRFIELKGSEFVNKGKKLRVTGFE